VMSSAAEYQPLLLAGIVVRTALPTMQQVQHILQATLGAPGNSSSSSSSSSQLPGAVRCAVALQRLLLVCVLAVLQHQEQLAADSPVLLQLASVTGSELMALTALQQLAGATALLHRHAQHSSSSSSSSIPAYHDDLLHLLPGGAAYFDVVNAGTLFLCGAPPTAAAVDASNLPFYLHLLEQSVVTVAGLLPHLTSKAVTTATVAVAGGVSLGACTVRLHRQLLHCPQGHAWH
jgi:hypothetical protein